MKISRKQKVENRKAIIRAAVELISEKGYKSSTMRQFAQSAGISDATIYNYFATKEAILLGYYLDHMAECIATIKKIDTFNTFSLQEQIQTLFETSLELYLPHREFVAQTLGRVMLRGSRDWAQIKPIREVFLEALSDMLDAAAEVGEIPEPVFKELTCQLFMDAYIGVVHYWLADTSQGFSDTSVLIDRGVDLACAVLKAGIANKAFDFAIFMFKRHILGNLDLLMRPLKDVERVKRRFMEGVDDG